MISFLTPEVLDMKQYPHVSGWLERMEKRKALAFVMEESAKAMRAAQH